MYSNSNDGDIISSPLFLQARKSYMNTRFYYIKKKMRDYYSNVGKKKGDLSYEC